MRGTAKAYWSYHVCSFNNTFQKRILSTRLSLAVMASQTAASLYYSAMHQSSIEKKTMNRKNTVLSQKFSFAVGE